MERSPMMYPFSQFPKTKRVPEFIMTIILLGVFLSGQALCQDNQSRLDFTLPVPESGTYRTYLGLPDDTSFSLGQIQADTVIIEIFSMYCPVCQREASDVNTLFNLIQNDEAIKSRVKLIGIGAGNSPFEVNFFKEKYTIEFPLFSDPDFSIHEKIGAVRTPHFFGLNLKKDGTFTVFYSESGEIADPEAFLKTLLEKSDTGKQP